MNTRIMKLEIKPGVWLEVYPDELCDWSWASKAELKRAEQGLIEQVFVRVYVFDKSGHVEGEDLLSGIVVRASRLKADVLDAVAGNDMVAHAKADLRRKLKEIRGAK